MRYIDFGVFLNGLFAVMTIYQQLEELFDLLNNSLFIEILGNEVPPCIITLQRKNNVFSSNTINAFVRINKASYIHEISLNPQYFGIRPRIELLQALAHQMMHLYQHEHGEITKLGSHDEQYLDFMNAIGLMPSSTGMPDGKTLGGKKMFNYPMLDGAFLKTANHAAQKGLLVDWLEVDLPKNVTVDSLVKEMHAVYELLDDFVQPALLDVPILVKMNIDVQSLLSCLRVDSRTNEVFVDQEKARDLAEDAIRESKQRETGEKVFSSTLNPAAVQHEPDEEGRDKDEADVEDREQVSAGIDNEDDRQILDESFQEVDSENQGSDLVDLEFKNDAAAQFLKQHDRPKPVAKPPVPAEPVIVKSTDEIASILGLETAGERKAPEKKKTRYQYKCSCGKTIWGGLDLNVICGVCQLTFKCETLDVEKNVVDMDY